MRARFQHVHLVGIGGIGMCGIAEVLLNLEYRVTGSDLRTSPITDRLSGLGATIYPMHHEDNVLSADVVVVSSAIAADNSEVRRAHALKIPVIPRAEMLAELMRLKHGIAIAGAHGKTTTTSLTASLLTDAGLDPTAVIGGRLRTLGSTSRLGRGDLLVAEADESDRSFLMLSPVIAVATNIDEEHMESYRDRDDLIAAFETFLNKVPFWGAAIVCGDDPVLASMPARLRRRVLTYGLDKGSDLTATDVWSRGHDSGFNLVHRGQELGPIRLPLPGVHNVQNALAAAAVALELGVAYDAVASGLLQFEGVDRRMDVKGEAAGVIVIDDYGHHPTEITATLKALRDGYDRRILCLFEPHRYSRVSRLLAGFADAFDDADLVLVTDLYAAGEPPIAGVDARRVTDAIVHAGHEACEHAGPLEAAERRALELARAGDLILTLGAGPVTHAADRILDRLRRR